MVCAPNACATTTAQITRARRRVARPVVTALSLFSGIGGLDLGVSRALERCDRALRTVAYVEREAYCCAVLDERIRAGALPAAPIWLDVTTFDARPFHGLVDLIIAGFPCQDLSVAGNRAGIDGARSGLWRHVVRVAWEVRPRLLFVENVSGLLDNAAMRRVLGDLAAIGFDAEWISVRASDVGAPHLRLRVFLLAIARRDPVERRGGSENVRAAPRGIEGEGIQRERSGNTAGDGGEDVANADRRGLESERLAQHAGQRGERRDLIIGSRADRFLVWPFESPMADARRERFQGEREAGSAAPTTGRGRGIPDWPPGPDADEWRAILEQRPDLAPALKPGFRRVANGLSFRVDQLRALGAAVVPAQAEAAFLELMGRIEDAKTTDD